MIIRQKGQSTRKEDGGKRRVYSAGYMKNKKRKRLSTGIKVLASAAGVVILTVGTYLIYVFSTYHRIEDRQPLEIRTPAQAGKEAAAGQEYSIVTYNIGFGAYTPEFSFFMDGGKSSVAKSEESVLATVAGAADRAVKEKADIYLFQEVDLDSTRSYHVDQYKILSSFFPEYASDFAVNYDSAFLFYPLTEPHGKSYAGLATYSIFSIDSALRRSLPISEDVKKVLDLDRCYSVSRIPVQNGRELVVYNIHMSAYGSDDTIREGQVSMICEDMEDEYKAGNYVICGGDFNHNLKAMSKEEESDMEWAKYFPREKLPKGLDFVLDSFGQEEKELLYDSARNTDTAYEEGKTLTVTLDGFIISDNIECISYETINTAYAYSDHEPVKMVFKLRE